MHSKTAPFDKNVLTNLDYPSMFNKVFKVRYCRQFNTLRYRNIPAQAFNTDTSTHLTSKSLDMGDEVSVGITAFTDRTVKGFSGIHKHKFSDFIVREVTRDGIVSSLLQTSGDELQAKHFTQRPAEEQRDNMIYSDQLPKKIANELRLIASSKSTDIDESAFNAIEEIVELYIKQVITESADCPASMLTFPCNSKESRTSMHKLIREHASAFIDTEAETVNGISYFKLYKKKGGNKVDDRNKKAKQHYWPEGLSPYLRFTLLKENIDTISAINTITSMLRIRSENITFNGTKDKRAVTAQKCTVYRRKPKDFDFINRSSRLPIIRIGDFEYVDQPCKLGELSGNRFTIVLRSINTTGEVVSEACEAGMRNGFINYFGLQRFGKGGSRSHHIGLAIFKDQFKDVIDMLFISNPRDRDEIAEAKLLYQNNDYKGALRMLPSSLHAEICVLEELLKRPNDYLGAFNRISRNTRLICAHAYQSSIWNLTVSERIKKYGLKLVVGDIVSNVASDEDLLLDQQTEAVDDDSSNSNSGSSHSSSVDTFQRASTMKADDIYIVTEDDISSNRYHIKDLLLPLPGFQIVLPSNDIGTYMIDLLAADGLSCEHFSKCSPQYRMSGAYRRVLQFPKDFTWSIVNYTDPNAELVSTELSNMRSASTSSSLADRRSTLSNYSMSSTESSNIINNSTISSNSNLANTADASSNDTSTIDDKPLISAAILNFTLPPGTYATMFLRELTKESTETEYQSQLSSTSTSTTVKRPYSSINSTTDNDENSDKISKS